MSGNLCVNLLWYCSVWKQNVLLGFCSRDVKTNDQMCYNRRFPVPWIVLNCAILIHLLMMSLTIQGIQRTHTALARGKTPPVHAWKSREETDLNWTEQQIVRFGLATSCLAIHIYRERETWHLPCNICVAHKNSDIDVVLWGSGRSIKQDQCMHPWSRIREPANTLSAIAIRSKNKNRCIGPK